MEIKSRNTNTLSSVVYDAMLKHGVPANSRNGPVLRIPGPVTLTITNPKERVNFGEVRDANPFFHLVEAMAMLAPVNSAPLMTHFAKSMALFTDDDRTYNAFYGTRARQWWPGEGRSPADAIDQLINVVTELQDKPETRQAVVQLWDPRDLKRITKDKACNLCMIFDIVDGFVNMTTFNRSNDAVLGFVTGANIVHLSFFHEWVAIAVDLPMGDWHHVSANFHVYTEHPKWIALSQARDTRNDYAQNLEKWDLVPLCHNTSVFDAEVLRLMTRMASGFSTLDQITAVDFHTPFLVNTVIPAYNAWQWFKRGDRYVALENCQFIGAPDWRLACSLWMERRVSP